MPYVVRIVEQFVQMSVGMSRWHSFDEFWACRRPSKGCMLPVEYALLSMPSSMEIIRYEKNIPREVELKRGECTYKLSLKSDKFLSL